MIIFTIANWVLNVLILGITALIWAIALCLFSMLFSLLIQAFENRRRKND